MMLKQWKASYYMSSTREVPEPRAFSVWGTLSSGPHAGRKIIMELSDDDVERLRGASTRYLGKKLDV